MAEKKTYYCEKCHRTMDGAQFYGSLNTQKYPEGKLTQCKKCLTMHVDNWNPETYLWILQECDVPYVQDEWNKILTKHGQNPEKVSGTTILGRYLSKMKLNQYSDYRWKDTQYLQDEANHKVEETMKRQGYSAAEIDQTIKQGFYPVPEKPMMPEIEDSEVGGRYIEPEPSATAFDLGLTEEDEKYLRFKWGKAYKPEEWVRLEQLYEEMKQSYDIQTAGHEDTLLLVCKTSLKANQLLDIGDVDGAQKMIKMYDGLMKSGKFTAAQNKAEQGEFVDSISELVLLCEKEGFIPRYYTEGPQDKVDKILLDSQQYVHDLITEETGLSNLIENAIKQLEKEKADIKAAAEGPDVEDAEDDALFNYNPAEITDQDFVDFNEFEDEIAEADEKAVSE